MSELSADEFIAELRIIVELMKVPRLADGEVGEPLRYRASQAIINAPRMTGDHIKHERKMGLVLRDGKPAKGIVHRGTRLSKLAAINARIIECLQTLRWAIVCPDTKAKDAEKAIAKAARILPSLCRQYVDASLIQRADAITLTGLPATTFRRRCAELGVKPVDGRRGWYRLTEIELLMPKKDQTKGH